jgi:predicted dithiol-disulfide oxidoreductase (DUF899 family)
MGRTPRVASVEEDDPMQFTNLPSESDAYRQAREELRLAEVDLMRHRERVAELRRALPMGPAVTDYELVEGAADLASDDGAVVPVTLPELFSGPDRPLIVYHFMFGKQQHAPCPMCTMWIDGFNGIARHVQENADFVVVAAAEPGALRRHARSRGWQGLRLLSAGASTFKYDLGSEDAQGVQDSRVSVFTRDGDGAVRHRYTSAPRMADDIDQRGIDLLCPTWHLLDLTPYGRDDWYASLHDEG